MKILAAPLAVLALCGFIWRLPEPVCRLGPSARGTITICSGVPMTIDRRCREAGGGVRTDLGDVYPRGTIACDAATCHLSVVRIAGCWIEAEKRVYVVERAPARLLAHEFCHADSGTAREAAARCDREHHADGEPDQ